MPAMSTRTSSAPPRNTSSIRSERYDDQDESRLPTRTTSATSSARRIWQSMTRPSLRPGSGGDDVVGRLDPFGRDRDPEPPGVVQVDRAADLDRGVERDPRRVLVADHLGDEQARLASVLGEVG